MWLWALALAAAQPAAFAVGARAAFGASVQIGPGCYRVGQVVSVRGTGFAPARAFTISIDGVYFGESTTDATGAFATSLRPGGLAAGVAQQVDYLEASDGTISVQTRFTLTRDPGARFMASNGNPKTLRAPFEVWGFSSGGTPVPVYLHYRSPTGHIRSTVLLGRAAGQCGYLRTGNLRLFPFTPRAGIWTLQIDTSRAYKSRPQGPVARIALRVTGP